VRERFHEGAGMEELAGYSRAVRHGNLIVVSGTGDLAGDGTIGNPGDTYAQARAAFERAVAAVERLGGKREDVVRTRVFLTPEADWRGALRAHKELFDSFRPANTTIIVAGFPARGMLVEVEVDAELSD
jgi:enamine deaminase RidA (YjgF/YER057c/UK114 family)